MNRHDDLNRRRPEEIDLIPRIRRVRKHDPREAIRKVSPEAAIETDRYSTAIGRAARSSTDDVEAHLRAFDSISLGETNKSAQMLRRIDNKYTIDKSTLWKILEELRNDYRVLVIDEKRIFSYQSCYFDDTTRCYQEHHQGRRQRFKVRTRKYVDTGDVFFEIKLKGKRGQTNKVREKCKELVVPEIVGKHLIKVRELYETNYHKPFSYILRPTLIIPYNRLTLVSVRGGERMTVDINIGFETPSGKKGQLGDNFVIVETKSEGGRGVADRVLKKHLVRQAEGCSKYCLGMILAGEVQKFNRFRKIIKYIIKSRDSSELSGKESQFFINSSRLAERIPC